MEEKAKKQLAELNAKQNADILALLDTEQAAETEREKILEAIEDETARLEKDEEFGVLRAKASDKIVRLAETHKRKLRMLSKKLGVKPPVKAK